MRTGGWPRGDWAHSLPLRGAAVVVGVAAAVTVLGSAPISGRAAAPVTAYSFKPSSLDGGGFGNVIAADPRHNGVVLAGTDTAGIQRSSDLGVTWAAAQGGSITEVARVVGAILFDPASPDTVYAATNAGVITSQDDGVTWAMLPAGPSFSPGNRSNPSQTPGLERCVGRLLAIDDSVSPPVLYAASTFQGLWRYDGTAWANPVTQAQLGGGAACNSGLAWAPGGSLDLATWGNGVFEIGNLGEAETVTPVFGAPAAVQELVGLGDGDVWGAGYTTGVGEIVNGTWTTSLVSSGEHFMSIDGYVNGSNDVIVAGSDQSPAVPGQPNLYATLRESMDSGATWSMLPSISAQVSGELLGPTTGDPWWHAAYPKAMMGAQAIVPSCVVVEHESAGDELWVSGYGGNWRLLGAEGQSTFYPSDFSLGQTFNHQIAIDPTTRSQPRGGQQIYDSNVDWTFLSSSDGFSSQQGIDDVVPALSASDGLAIAVDGAASPPMIYLATGNRDLDTHGGVFAAQAPASTAAAFHSLDLGRLTGGHRPLGIGVVDTARTPTLIVPVEGKGVWTKVGSKGWRRDTSLFMKNQSPTGALAVGSGSQARTVYAYDRVAGVYRSLDAGAPGSWRLIWRHASTVATPFLMVDKANPTTLWVIAAEGLFRLDHAASSTFGSQTPLVAGQVAGLAQLGNEVFTTSLVAGTGLELLASDSTETTFTDIADSTLHTTLALVSGMDVADDGTLYIATPGWGVIVGTPSS